MSVLLPFWIILDEEEDVHRVAGELCAGFLHGPGTLPLGIEAVLALDWIDGSRVYGEQRLGVLQHVAEQLGLGIVILGAALDKKMRPLVSNGLEGGLVEVQCVKQLTTTEEHTRRASDE
jgi:hypothetical protein